MLHRATCLALVLAAIAPLPLLAAESADTVLDEVLVIGEQPGPPMWRVSKGDHTLWIMGTLTPLPAKMSWRSVQAERVIRESGEILGASRSDVDADIGIMEAVRLLRALSRLRYNADGSTLRDALPAEVYERWHAAHRRWFGKDPSPKERARPSYAAELLYEKALERSGLTGRPVVWSTVRRLAARHDVRIRQRRFPLTIEDPRGLVAELETFPAAREVACLVATMDFIDREMPDLRRRAQAWATGNLAELRALPRENPRASCEDELIGHTRLGRLLREEEARYAEDWSGIVDWLLLTHATSFTTLPVTQLLDEDDVLARLRAKGYEVQAPR
jgi:uncharacterized protein YbaP (TraB family)